MPSRAWRLQKISDSARAMKMRRIQQQQPELTPHRRNYGKQSNCGLDWLIEGR